jgi:hypothetical protein
VQFNTLFSQMALPKQLLSRCPACFLNFRTFLCDLTCHPEQHTFLAITQSEPTRNHTLNSRTKVPNRTLKTNNENKTKSNPSQSEYDYSDEDYMDNSAENDDVDFKENNDNESILKQEIAQQVQNNGDEPNKKIQVIELMYHITNYYVDNLYKSCKDVQYSASGQKALDVMCGSPSSGCTPDGFVIFLGNNDHSPFVFLMNITDESYLFNGSIPITPVNSSVYNCSTKIDIPNFTSESCGCSVRIYINNYFNLMI